MKKIIISTIMVVLVAGFVTAYPNQHSGNANRHGYTMDKSARGERFAPISELKELKGELVVKENSFPSIKVSGGEETIITLGASTVESLKLENGSKITVRGIEVPYGMNNTTDTTVLKVDQLDFNNKTYVVHGGGRHGKNDDRNGGRHGGGCGNGRNSGGHGYDKNDSRHGGRG